MSLNLIFHISDFYHLKIVNNIFFFIFEGGLIILFRGWLVVWALWHINLCRLFNAKSIFMKIVLFQTIQFSISMQLKCKYSLFVKNISISSYSV